MDLPPALSASALDAAIQSGIAWVYSFQPLAERTVLLCPPSLQALIGSASALAGLDYETTAMVLGLFLAYPLGVLFNFVPGRRAKHFFSAFFGAAILQAVLAVQWAHLLLVAGACYLLFLLLPPPACRYLVPAFAMGYCVMGHLHRQYVNYMVSKRAPSFLKWGAGERLRLLHLVRPPRVPLRPPHTPRPRSPRAGTWTSPAPRWC